MYTGLTGTFLEQKKQKPTSDFDVNSFFCGFQIPKDAGYIYMPYIPMIITKTKIGD